jgi:alkylation response protein AidB-like acyl-CoA dehydrogenase
MAALLFQWLQKHVYRMTCMPPLRDTRFSDQRSVRLPRALRGLPNGGEEATPDMVDAILEGCAAFCEEVLAPLNLSGDKEGCTSTNGEVTTPKGFKEAYDQFVEGGWQGLSHPGIRRPGHAHVAEPVFKAEMMGTANWSFNMYPGLSLGA